MVNYPNKPADIESPELVLRIMEGARTLIEEEEQWTQSSWARMRNGDACSELSSSACSFCLKAALARTTHKILCDPANDNVYSAATVNVAFVDACWLIGTYTTEADHEPNVSLILFNDSEGRKHSEVIDAVDKGIREIKATLQSKN